jgi:hypothetical protein
LIETVVGDEAFDDTDVLSFYCGDRSDRDVGEDMRVAVDELDIDGPGDRNADRYGPGGDVRVSGRILMLCPDEIDLLVRAVFKGVYPPLPGCEFHHQGRFGLGENLNIYVDRSMRYAWKFAYDEYTKACNKYC